MNSNNTAAIDVIHVLVRSTHALQREFQSRLSAHNLPYQVSGPRLRLLSIVSESGPMRMNEIAASLGVKARTVTDFIDALEADKLLVRIPDPTDRRATLIQLTELAQNTLDQALVFQAQIAEDLLGHFSPEQREQFYDLLQILMKNNDMTNACLED
ncbi:MarR family transcriptional regulator [Paenibacillus sp. GSMTC-2017]|uniref:MarR family winged helix-turn-helix transcriptional regulator n=1 Tax=Paenibacillus sp. GSMTC-2017 TaxID=2794350 RepID=UPI0018D8C70A|nr:MarR family transcriptional regulator [Paenibacillus sp. GSMTC-2017]MBH5319541.1 MarR family transcriptional regulator [Paenibacillus sp. GSMTC-2017]